jgi:excisionase family DNA binding protein
MPRTNIVPLRSKAAGAPAEAKPPRRLTIKWAAEQLGYSVPFTRQLIAQGKLRAYGTGHATRISEEAVRHCVVLLEQERCPS